MGEGSQLGFNIVVVDIVHERREALGAQGVLCLRYIYVLQKSPIVTTDVFGLTHYNRLKFAAAVVS